MAMKSGKFFNKFGLLTAALGFAGMVYAGSEPAPPPFPVQFKGPAVMGDLTLMPAASCSGIPEGCVHVNLSFSGNCKGDDVSLNIVEFNLSNGFLDVGEDVTDITEAGLESRYVQTLGNALLAQNPGLMCNSNSTQGGPSEGVTDPDMAINTVNRFSNNNGIVNANIIMLFAPLSNNPND